MRLHPSLPLSRGTYNSLPFPTLTLVQAVLSILLRIVRLNLTRPEV